MRLFSVAALAVLLTPMAASAHGFGFNFGSNVRAALEDHRNHDNKDKHKDKSDKHIDRDRKSATTSASLIAKASARITDWADLMAAMSGTISAKIAGSDLSANEKADANANLSDYNGNLADAKAKAAAAADTAAKVDSDNGTTTNASFLAEARADLSAAWDFLKSAKKELGNILRSLWGDK